jgi:7-carboxy-7-deazaguanine synthase (Cx14CxxC type)
MREATMPYHVKEIFATLQGEGMHAGTAAVFLRFAGCNLWNGLESGRAEAVCKFCDTDFVGGTRYAFPATLALAVQEAWGGQKERRRVVITGGEPGLQLDAPLVTELHALGFDVAVETNGTLPLPIVDWLTVSPKAGTDVVCRRGNELKVVVPQEGLDLVEMERWDFRHFIVQPMAGHPKAINTAIAWAMTRPRWRVGIQMHKALGIP